MTRVARPDKGMRLEPRTELAMHSGYPWLPEMKIDKNMKGKYSVNERLWNWHAFRLERLPFNCRGSDKFVPHTSRYYPKM